MLPLDPLGSSLVAGALAVTACAAAYALLLHLLAREGKL